MSTFRTSQAVADRPAGRSSAARDDEGRLRLIWIWLEVLCGVAVTFAVIWDTQFHVAVGRERFLTPPHLMLYSGLLAGFLVAAAGVVITTWRYRQRAPGADDRTTSALPGGLRAAPGHAAVVLGLASTFPAMPLDDYWHRLYGIDATIWAPFHLMPVPGTFLAVAGVLYAAYAEANRRAPGFTGLTGMRALGLLILGVLLIVPVMMTAPLIKHPILVLVQHVQLPLYVPALALIAPLFLLAANRSMIQPGGATAMAALFSLLLLLLVTYVPLAVAMQAAAEGQPFRPGAPGDVYELAGAPLLLLLPALAVDAMALLAARRGWAAGEWVPWAGALAAVLACLADRPWQPFVLGAASGSAWHLLVLSLPLAAGIGALAGVAGVRAGDALREAGR